MTETPAHTDRDANPNPDVAAVANTGPDGPRAGRSVFIVASEPSGDVLGAELIDEIGRRGRNDVTIHGVGGPMMAERGVASPVDTTGLQTIGALDGLRALSRARTVAVDVAQTVQSCAPDAVVLIDSWGFSLRVAMALREQSPDITIVKYIGPQLWAHRPGRAKQLAQWVDALLCIFPFEVPFYQPHGLPTHVVGYPPLSRVAPGDGSGFRRRHGLTDDDELVLVLFGSRPKEIERLADPFEDAVRRILAHRPGAKIVTMVSEAVAEALAARQPRWDFEAIVVTDETQKPDVFAAATVALACSGTVTTEVALYDTPVVVGYRIDWLTWVIARIGFLNTKYITLMNVMAGAEIAPELVQTRCTGRLLSDAVLALLADPARAAAQCAAQGDALDKMGRGGPVPVTIAADVVLQHVDAGR